MKTILRFFWCFALVSTLILAEDYETANIKEQKEREFKVPTETTEAKKEPTTEIREPEGAERKMRQKIRIYFGHDSAHLGAEEAEKLQKLEVPANAVVMVAGYASSYGTAGYNLRLSKRRAQVIYYRLKKRFKDADVRMTYFGESKTRFLNSTARGRALNRSTEVKVFY